MGGSVIFHHLIGMQYIRSNLASPLDFLEFTTKLGQMICLFLLFFFQQAGQSVQMGSVLR